MTQHRPDALLSTRCKCFCNGKASRRRMPTLPPGIHTHANAQWSHALPFQLDNSKAASKGPALQVTSKLGNLQVGARRCTSSRCA